MQWAERLAAFNYDVQYVRVLDNTVADALSWLPLPSSGFVLPDISRDIPLHHITGEGITLAEIQAATSTDEVLSKVVEFIRMQWPSKGQQITADLLPYYHVQDEIHLEQGWPGPRLPVRGPCWAMQVDLGTGTFRSSRHLTHETPDQGDLLVDWTYMHVHELVSQCSGCSGCQMSEKSMPPAKVPDIDVLKPANCWAKVGLDISGPFADAPGNQKFIVTVIDYASNFLECLLTTDIRSSQIIRWLETVFCCVGNQSVLVSDNGPQFASSEFQGFLQHHGVEHIQSAMYNLTENGLVEVFNHTLKHGILSFAHDHLLWEEGIEKLLKTYQATPPTSDVPSPAEQFYLLLVLSNSSLTRPSACLATDPETVRQGVS